MTDICTQCKLSPISRVKHIQYFIDGKPVYWKLCVPCIKENYMQNPDIVLVKEMTDPNLEIGDTVRMQYPPKFNYGWISINERFPENKQIVLCVNNEEMAVCRFDKTEWEYFFMLNNTSHQVRKVTHWMDLPSAPK